MAVFAEGGLSEAERRIVEEHIAACDECYAIWQGDVELLATEPAEPGKLVRGSFGRRVIPAAIAAAIAIAFLIPQIREEIPGFGPSGMQKLIRRAEKLDQRPFEARLSQDFPYKRPSSKRGKEAEKKIAETLMTLEAKEVAADPKSGAHEKATALLLLNRPDEAIMALENELAAKGPDARLLNDLAVAYLQHNESDRALDAIERGLAIEKTPALLFNRALVLRYRGDDAKARAAWDDYLKVDGDSKWADEAREKRGPLTESH